MLVALVTIPGIVMIFLGPALVTRYRRRRVHQRETAIKMKMAGGAPQKLLEADRLKDRARECFYPVQDSWRNGDVSQSRRYVSDVLYERHRLQLEEMKRRRRANRIEDLVLTDVRLVRLRRATNGSVDRFAVRIQASARDWVSDLRRGVVVGGDPDSNRPFTEYWDFARHPVYGWVLDEIQQHPWRLPFQKR